MHTVAALFPFENIHLVKDVGLIPYLLHKDHGMSASLVFALPKSLSVCLPGDAFSEGYISCQAQTDPAFREKIEELYPYAALLRGVNFCFLPDFSWQSILRFLERNALQIDLLLLSGPCGLNMDAAIAYKRLHPRGIVYCALDMNSIWADRIYWYGEKFMAFMDAVDYKAASCTAIRDYLCKKWPWEIRLVPNGSYLFHPALRQKVDFQERKNIILSAARLGIYPKATGVLLQSFLRIAEEIPDWTLRLVGAVAPEFQPVVDRLSRIPSLSGRIEFAGFIEDRQALALEYRQAKIFALPSRWEGGSNAAADALYHGLVMAVTKVDAYEDMVCGGKTGLSAPIDDISAFSDILLRLCQDPGLAEKSENAYRRGREFYDMERIVEKLYADLRDLYFCKTKGRGGPWGSFARQG